MRINLKFFKRCPKCGNELIKEASGKEWVPAYEGTFLVTSFICLNCGHHDYTGREVTDIIQWILNFLF